MRLFVTATDTEVGKTRVSALIARQLRENGRRVAAFKPVSCGDRGDAESLMAAARSGLSLEEINPVHFAKPVAPSLAGELEFEDLIRKLRASAAAFESVVTEGVGGWLAPLTANEAVRDLATRLAAPVLVVVGDRLGAINHARLTVESIRQSALPLAGIVLNEFAAEAGQWGNEIALRSLFGGDFWGVIPHGATAWPEALRGRLA